MFEPLMECGSRRRDLRSGWVSTAAAAHGVLLFALAAASVFARVDAGMDPLPPIAPVDHPRDLLDVRLGDPNAGSHHGGSVDRKREDPKPPEKKKAEPPKAETQPVIDETVPAPETPPLPSGHDDISTPSGAIDGDDGPDGDGTGTGPPGLVGDPRGNPYGKDKTGPVVPGPRDEREDETGYGVEPPVLLVRVEPVYPDLERLGKVEGTVLLEALVGTAGKVESVRVLASPRAGLTAAAVRAVERWRYKPARRNGRAVGVTVRIEVRFELR
jgi:TonB family protein